MPLPNLIVIGAAKCGTTSLRAYLDLHPEIAMATMRRATELDFFSHDEQWRRGVGWYERLFPDAPVRGEVSPSYSTFPFNASVPERMAGVVPDVRLVYLVGDPIERVESQWHFAVANHAETWPYEDAIAGRYETYVAASRYATQLERFLPHFPQERIVVVDQHDLRHDRTATLRGIFGFLGVDESFTSLGFERESNVTGDTRQLSRLGRKTYLALHGTVGHRLTHAVASRVPGRIPVLERRSTSERPATTGELRARLAGDLGPQAARLRELTGKDFAKLVRLGRDRPLSSDWLWLPVGLAALDVGLLLGRLGHILDRLYLSSDIASAPVIASLIGSAPGDRVVTLGDYPWYEPLWFMQATHWLPAHRQLWEIAPLLFSAAGIALVVWAALRVFGGWVAALTGALLCCTTPAMRFDLLAPNAHGSLLLHGAALGAALVYLNLRAGQVSTLVLVVGGVVLALFSAAGESDVLFLSGGLIPFVLTALAGWWRTGAAAQRRIAFFAICTTAAAVAAGELAKAAMRGADIVAAPLYHVHLVDRGSLVDNLQSLAEDFARLGAGDFFGQPIRVGGLVTLAAGLLVLAAAVLVLRAVWRATPDVVQTAPSPTPAAAAREAYLVFWSLTLLGTIAAFVLTNAASGGPVPRYLFVGYVAVAALLPAVTSGSERGRVLVLAGVSAFLVLGIRADLGHIGDRYGRVSRADVQRLADYVSAQGLTTGYGDYAVAPVTTWATHLKTKVFPVSTCGDQLCPFYLHTISSWYRPRPGMRSFLVVDPAANSYRPVSGPPSGSGEPIDVQQFGDLTVYVYDHDLAADMG